METLEFVIAFLKATLVPVAPAAVFIGLFIDYVLKRMPFWKDGWGGKASLALNMLFSAGLFIAAQYGKGGEYLQVVGQLGTVFILLITIVTGFFISKKTHTTAVDAGMGRSLTEEAWQKQAAEMRAAKANG